MSKWSLCFVVLVLVAFHTVLIGAWNQQKPGAREAPMVVSFDDILSRAVVREPAKRVFKRQINDDFTIDDEPSLNESAEALPLPAGDDVTLSTDAASDGEAIEDGPSAEDTIADNKETSADNELDDSMASNEGQEESSPDQSISATGEVTEKEETVPIKVTTEAVTSEEGNEEETDEVMAVDILPSGVEINNIRGNLIEGSGDFFTDEEGEENNQAGQDFKKAPEETEETTAIDITIDDDSNETISPEIPIPSPTPAEEDLAAKELKEEGLFKVSATDSVIPTDSSEESSGDGSIEGSGEGFGMKVSTSFVDSKESGESETITEKSEAPQVPSGRKFENPEEIATPEEPAQTDATEVKVLATADPNQDSSLQTEDVSNENVDTAGTEMKKTGIEVGNEGGINEMGVNIDKEEATDGTGAKENASSSGSFIVLGAIMVTIVVLLAYTVVKSRRHKKARRTGHITKPADEDPGREMKEVDKLLAPRTNGFSQPNGGARDDERTPLNSFKNNDILPVKNGYLPENAAEGLTDVVVENVPRLNLTPANGAAPTYSPREDDQDQDQDSWVQGGKALESTKIKMYIDEDSIPKTPIVIVNRGSTPNEM